MQNKSPESFYTPLNKISGYRILSRNAIKYIAVFAMLLNHINYVFMKKGTLISDLFENIGYFTAFVMLYFLVEGYHFTHSKKKYALRLFIFAVISQLPFSLAFSPEKAINFVAFNMLFTILICFSIIYVHESNLNPYFKLLYKFAAVFISSFCDWPILAPLITMLFISAKEMRISLEQAFIVSIFLFILCNFSFILYETTLLGMIYRTALYLIGPVSAAICILFFYNGKKSGSFSKPFTHFKQNLISDTFSKWFFYLFYPLHLSILAAIKFLIK